MNEYKTTLKLIRDRLLSNPDVNTCIHARKIDKEIFKKTIYPMTLVNWVESPTSSSRVSYFTFEVGAFDQRDISKFARTDKFLGNDNLQDNENTIYNILNDLINYIRTQNNSNFIELHEVSSIRPVLYTDEDLVDCAYVNITLKIPNQNSFC